MPVSDRLHDVLAEAPSQAQAGTQTLYKWLAFTSPSSCLKTTISSHQIFADVETVWDVGGSGLPVMRRRSLEGLDFFSTAMEAVQSAFHSTTRTLGKSLTVGADHAFVQENGLQRNKKFQTHLLRSNLDNLNSRSVCIGEELKESCQHQPDAILLTVSVPSKDLWTGKAFNTGPWSCQNGLLRGGKDGKLLNPGSYRSVATLPLDQLNLVKSSMDFIWDHKETTQNGKSSESGTDFFIPIGEGELAKMIRKGDWTLTPQNFLATSMWADVPSGHDKVVHPSIPCYLTAMQAAMHYQYLEGAVKANAMKPKTGLPPQFNEAQGGLRNESLPEVCALLQVSIDLQRLMKPTSDQMFKMRPYGLTKIPFEVMLLDGKLSANDLLGWSLGRGHMTMEARCSVSYDSVSCFKIEQQQEKEMDKLEDKKNRCEWLIQIAKRKREPTTPILMKQTWGSSPTTTSTEKKQKSDMIGPA